MTKFEKWMRHFSDKKCQNLTIIYLQLVKVMSLKLNQIFLKKASESCDLLFVSLFFQFYWNLNNILQKIKISFSLYFVLKNVQINFYLKLSHLIYLKLGAMSYVIIFCIHALLYIAHNILRPMSHIHIHTQISTYIYSWFIKLFTAELSLRYNIMSLKNIYLCLFIL